MNKPRCTVCSISLLRDNVDEVKEKLFQTFEAGGYKLVTGSHYINGQLGVIIPIGAIVPDNITEEMWVKDKLGGKKRNRVVAKTMFGYPSEGLFYGRTWIDGDGIVRKALLWNDNWKVGDDVTKELGVTFNGEAT